MTKNIYAHLFNEINNVRNGKETKGGLPQLELMLLELLSTYHKRQDNEPNTQELEQVILSSLDSIPLQRRSSVCETLLLSEPKDEKGVSRELFAKIKEKHDQTNEQIKTERQDKLEERVRQISQIEDGAARYKEYSHILGHINKNTILFLTALQGQFDSISSLKPGREQYHAYVEIQDKIPENTPLYELAIKHEAKSILNALEENPMSGAGSGRPYIGKLESVKWTSAYESLSAKAAKSTSFQNIWPLITSPTDPMDETSQINVYNEIYGSIKNRETDPIAKNIEQELLAIVDNQHSDMDKVKASGRISGYTREPLNTKTINKTFELLEGMDPHKKSEAAILVLDRTHYHSYEVYGAEAVEIALENLPDAPDEYKHTLAMKTYDYAEKAMLRHEKQDEYTKRA